MKGNLRPGDYARTRIRGYDIVFMVDRVERDLVRGEDTDRFGSDATMFDAPYSIGDTSITGGL
jgi:hypothetical protein